MQPKQIELDGGVTALRRGPDHLPRRRTPKAFDELYASVHAHETTRHWEEKFGWDRASLRDGDDLNYQENRHKLQPINDAGNFSGAIAFRHTGWENDRNRVQGALNEVFADKSSPHRFGACGDRVIVCRERDNPSGYVLVGNYCKNRWCVPCGNARSAEMGRQYQSHLSGKTLRFVTLTLKSDSESLADLIAKIYKDFAKLQRTRLWIATVRGGVAFLELKYNHSKLRWHPHLHVICEGKFLPQKALSNAWLKITGTSYIVDVRLVRDSDQAIQYVTKYATKPSLTTIVGHHDLLCEAIKALHGKRMMIRFGSFREFDLTKDNETHDLVPIMSLHNLLQGCRSHTTTSLAIMVALRGLDVETETLSLE